jgi:multisubunit Na+/H+ antiporter MnhG subunit
MIAAIVVFVLLLAVVAPIALYYLVRAEHDERETMERNEAERTARRDTRDRE